MATHFSGPIVSANGFVAGTGSISISKIAAATASLNFPSIASQAQADLTITVSGAAVGDYVVLDEPAAPAAGLVFNAFVSAANTVTVRASNISSGAVDEAALTFGVLVLGTTAV